MRFYVASTIVFACIANTATGQNASFQGIGDLPGGLFFSTAQDISRDGSTIVGDSSSYNSYFAEAVKWTATGGLEPLGLLPGHNQSTAFGVSPRGNWVVGESVLSPEHVEAFAWSQETGTFGLGDLPGGRFRSIARAVSRNGRVIVGSASVEIDGRTAGAPFRWTPETGMESLGYLGGTRRSGSASDVTPDGSVIVGSVSIDVGVGTAFRWTEAGGMVGLGDLPGGVDQSSARAVSADGRWIVGTGSSESMSGGTESQAVRWNEFGEIEGLGFLPGESFGRYSRASDVSDDGQMVVGTAYSSGYDGGAHAVLWTPNEGIRTIESILLDYGIDIAAEGWVRLSSASGISGDGRTIAGTGGVQGLGTQGWVVTLPIPAPTTLAPLAAMGLLGMRRRR
ncbi:MAG: PEP-CTERM sorting domain-containing protein [Planctomycetota bacterium]|nr:PEP-CTERM sorting domain-containing protein [Planctomycetota bacterium]